MAELTVLPSPAAMATTNMVALLRAINLAGLKSVSMADLKAMLAKLGFDGARSLLASGNLVFAASDRVPASAKLESLLEAEATKRLKLETDFFVRSAAEMRAMVGRNPFPAEAKRDPGHLVALFLKGAVDEARIEALRAAIVGREQVAGVGREVFAFYPDGIGRSKLTMALIERKLGVRGTGRNWNTVLKLEALAHT
jgi:uncharacterized protein (DUF1697 family)